MLYFDQHVRASLMEINPFVACSGLAYRSFSLESIGHRSLLPFGKPIQYSLIFPYGMNTGQRRYR